MFAQNGFQAILFDVGGVLAADVWQSLVLTPERGLADRLDLDRNRAAEVAEQLWDRYAIQAEADESDYWSDFGEAIGLSIPDALIASLEQELLYANPEAAVVLRALPARGIRIGVVSNNTAFWYAKQARLVGLDRAADPDLLFLSFRLGATKDQVPGLFEMAADQVPSGSALVVDDRKEYVARARSLGFHAVHYPRDWQYPLSAVLTES